MTPLRNTAIRRTVVWESGDTAPAYPMATRPRAKGSFEVCFAAFTIGIADVPDGLSNTLLIGEGLPSEDAYLIRAGNFDYPGGNWAFGNGGNNLNSTIIPINYKITPDTYCH